ncbi:PilC/PilY family type IV pilus protein [Alteromonas sp. ASW11-130]|uniref:PilC/PilY family type IV pilus protein n=1 Tax=Alteromonas sp. ASW11-130 TaxID=3015775 RepID=UPI0022421310|nr:PilC/PilY family type IV pilus protein [Alteromonas sp. ASW11-130]MCW8092921.1 PilC/PilY family type IV pilus protein [Alteromonas sp. ASW11-130]
MKHLTRLIFSVSLWGCIGWSAMADDLDIYLGTSSNAVTYNPNVLFIMDTSGSMRGMDGGDESRMLRVQNALKLALGSATNINAGLMRFSDYGGPVLFPIRSIDEAVSPEIITSTASGNDDAHEIGGVVSLSADNIKLSDGTGEVLSGMRFSDLDIPQGATITSAYIRLTSGGTNFPATTFSIRGELTPDSTSFTNTTNNLSSRTKTANEVIWDSDNAFPLTEEIITTPDLGSIVQEVVDQADWCGGRAMSILITGNSSDTGSNRRVKSYDQGEGGSPQLVVTYDESTATGCIAGESIYQVDSTKDNVEEKPNGYDATGSELTFNSNYNDYIGIRFENVNIPQGAEITEAYLEFTAYDTDRWNSASMRIRGVADDNASDFHPHKRFMVRNLPKTSGITWSMPYFYRNRDYQTPELKAIVQQVVDRIGWVPGNAMAFVFDNFNGVRGAYSYKGKPSGAPRLVVKFNGNATPGTSATVRDHLISKVDELSANGLTPIVDTLYEATNYFGGLDVDYGLTRGRSDVSSSVRRSTRVSHRASYVGLDPVRDARCLDDNLSDSACITEYIPSGATYISPVTDMQCQTNNHIVLLSDGEANNNHSVSKIESLLAKNCTGSGGEKCGIDLVSNLSKAESSVIDRRIITHTIGFAANATANNFLNQLAVQSGGGFYKADNSTELLSAFETILRSVKDINATFVSPGVAVNQLNRLTHRDELYFALFKPAEGTIWPGNLKKYKIDGDKILDKNGLEAVDSVTGFFADGSHSYWSVLEDGNDVREGGAASLLNSSRQMYFFSGAGTIASAANAVHESNTSITTDDLAISAEPDATTLRETILKWARGVDVRDVDGDGDTTDVRLQMGDPIHSQPVIVNYGLNDSAIFVATNHGFLHSFDAYTGEENFSVIPKELMTNLYDFYKDNSSFNHIYGLDGDMVLRTVGNKTYLYIGMRRGGRNYYVFDVSSKLSPKLVFSVKGGTPGLEKMGQTWSRPTITKVRMGDTVKNVMIVGGGYDDEQDSKVVRASDNTGNALYILDADTGSLLWHASNAGADLNLTDMQYSVPGRISVIDRDNDGFADHMYMADMGGQLFRFDIYNGKFGTDFIKGAKIADLAGDDEQNNRHFYYGADVTEVALADEHYYGVAIGSGWRASPLDTVVDDRFYLLKDKGVFQRDADGLYVFNTGITESSLYDATDHLLSSSDESERAIAASQFASKEGWFIRLTTDGEKVLSSPLIIDYKVFFTTYVPASSSLSACAPPTGNSRAYLVNMFNGNAVDDLNQNSNLDSGDRYAQLKQTGIAPETKILIEEIVKPVVCLGTECVSAVISEDEDGNEEACLSDFACLARNIYGKFERIQRGSWKTETERE